MNVVDSLVVTLGLDTSDYLRNSRTARDEIKRVLNESGTAARTIEADGKRAASFVRGLRNETVGLFLAFAGANSVKSFAMDIIGTDAATKRLADNLGVAGTKLLALQGAARANGGTSADANSTYGGIIGSYQNYQLTGSTGHDADFQGLGVSLADLKNGPDAVLQRMAAASERMTRPEFTARLQRIGIPDSVITSLALGSKGYAELIAQQARLAKQTEDDLKKAVAFDNALSNLTTTIKGSAAPVVEELAGVVLSLSNNVDLANVGTPLLVGGLVALAAPAVALAAPFIALGAAVAGVTAAVNALLDAQPRLKSFLDDAESPLKSWLGPKFAWLFKRPGDSSGGRPAAGGSAGGSASAYGGGASSSLFERLIRQESGGRAGIAGPMTMYGQAHGLTQMLDGTAMQMARKLGVAWQPGLMRGTSAAAIAYQRLLGKAYLDEGLARYGGDEAKALMFYHGGPNQRLWGAKTHAYASSILGMGIPRGPTSGGAQMGGNSSTVSIGSIVVNTAATDGAGVARDLRANLAQRGLVRQADSGMRQ